MVNAVPSSSITPSSFSPEDITQIALCFETLSEQFQTLGQIFRGTLDRSSQSDYIHQTGHALSSSQGEQSVIVPQTSDKQTTPKGLKRKKRERDPNAPSRPPSAYLIYCKHAREEMNAEELEANKGQQLMLTLGKGWRELSDEDRATFIEQAAVENAKYQEKLAAYKAQSGEPAEPEDTIVEESGFVLPKSAEVNPEVASPQPKKRKPAAANKAFSVFALTQDVTPTAQETVEVPEAPINDNVAPAATTTKSQKQPKVPKQPDTPKTRSSNKKKKGEAAPEPVAVTEPEAAPETVISPTESQEGGKKKKPKKFKKTKKANGVASN